MFSIRKTRKIKCLRVPHETKSLEIELGKKFNLAYCRIEAVEKKQISCET